MARLMPYLLIILLTLVAALAVVTASESAPRPDRPSVRLTKRIDMERQRTFKCQHQLGLKQSPVSSSPVNGERYRRWVLTVWTARANAYCRMARELGHPAAAARAVWGARHHRAAVTVGRCESGLSTSARNGQYLGVWQMGSSERRLYGHGSSALEQARAAHRYFVASGRDWSPWSCKPDGSVQ